ncbi:DUF6525 family protein [Leisingera sp.]|uniref:DUF6525 family protein n=1 Tax=Leisingera sp. TaxID=1879318 RepID=UPI002B279700|nr:DUF6525 family protein [Leisingera sp.]
MISAARRKGFVTRRGSNARTSLPRSKQSGNPMAAFDQLPADLREWLRQAALPWSPRSALRVWRSALKKHGGDRTAACAYLSQVELKNLKQEAGRIWGAE